MAFNRFCAVGIMYIPGSFRQDDVRHLHDFIAAHPLGMLITNGPRGLQASPLPFLLYSGEGEQGVLRTHLARANPHWQDLQSCTDCLLMFQGPNAYVTPSWYPSKEQTHRVVPTWNYIAVEVRGRVEVHDDAVWLRRLVEDLTRQQEGVRPVPWAVTDAPEDFIAAQLKAIVGIELQITQIEGKWKLSQNRPAADRQGVIRGMRDETDAHHNAALGVYFSEK